MPRFKQMGEVERKTGLWNFAKTTVMQWLAEEPFQLAAALA